MSYCRRARPAVFFLVEDFIVQARRIVRALQRRQSHAFCSRRAIASGSKLQRALLDMFGKLLRLDGVIPKPPLSLLLPRDAIRVGAEHVCMAAAQPSLLPNPPY